MSELKHTKYLRDLRRQMVALFSSDELKALSFDVGIDWDTLPGEEKNTKVQSLIMHHARRGRLSDLTILLREERPDGEWPEVPSKEKQKKHEAEISPDFQRETELQEFLQKMETDIIVKKLAGGYYDEATIVIARAYIKDVIHRLDKSRLVAAIRFLAGINLSGEINATGLDLSGCTLIGANLEGIKLNRANLKNSRLYQVKLNKAELSFADLGGADMEEAELYRADLYGAYLINCKLSRAILTRANLSGANLSFTDLSKAVLPLANLRRTDLTGANLTDAWLPGADLNGAILSKAKLKGAVLNGTSEDYSRIYSVTRVPVEENPNSRTDSLERGDDLSQPLNQRWRRLGGRSALDNVTRTDLRGAKLDMAVLTGVDLSGANLAGADLNGADLVNANLIGADLSHTNLSHVDLSRAKLFDANLGGANLRGAKMSGLEGWTFAQLEQATLHNVHMPDGLYVGVIAPSLDGRGSSSGIIAGYSYEEWKVQYGINHPDEQAKH